MASKIIQVPVNEELLTALDALSKARGRPRSEIIREACRAYLRRVDEARLEEAYVQGYRRLPEETGLGEAQVALTGDVLPPEEW